MGVACNDYLEGVLTKGESELFRTIHNKVK